MDRDLATDLGLDLMARAEAAFLSTVNPAGFPETRAMLNLRNREMYPNLVPLFERLGKDFVVYFTTNTSSLKVAQLRSNPKVSVYYCLPGEWQGIMLGGLIEFIEDETLRRALWQEEWTRYYPQGVNDPDHTVLRLRPSSVKGYHRLQFYSWEADV